MQLVQLKILFAAMKNLEYISMTYLSYIHCFEIDKNHERKKKSLFFIIGYINIVSLITFNK
jgi:hypothetical protein